MQIHVKEHFREHVRMLCVCVQVVERLALEDTDIQAEHIEQIKELIQKEDIIQSIKPHLDC